MRSKLLLTIFLISSLFSVAQELKPIILPLPDMKGGKPLMEALKDRKTSRNFAKDKLSLQMLSDLLWAACGINRPESGKRTAPSAVDWQEIDVYVVLEEGAYLYNPKDNKLEPVAAGDFRGKMGIQGFVGDAPVVLAFVSDHSKMSVITTKDQKDFYSATDTGYISQNVYLFCASEDLATVVLGLINRDNISRVLKLKSDQKVILTQCVGFPGK
jgi:SagB-type dehydrogenase family enzyme